eukprot:GHVN01106911.1.p1 GENE.GHVN01106911.1~~GHVN01106911.1.p1  ORF type:complete len:3262 (+),score=387.98 GHVN01106911.1:1469-9787(+)
MHNIAVFCEKVEAVEKGFWGKALNREPALKTFFNIGCPGGKENASCFLERTERKKIIQLKKDVLAGLEKKTKEGFSRLKKKMEKEADGARQEINDQTKLWEEAGERTEFARKTIEKESQKQKDKIEEHAKKNINLQDKIEETGRASDIKKFIVVCEEYEHSLLRIGEDNKEFAKRLSKEKDLHIRSAHEEEVGEQQEEENPTILLRSFSKAKKEKERLGALFSESGISKEVEEIIQASSELKNLEEDIEEITKVIMQERNKICAENDKMNRMRDKIEHQKNILSQKTGKTKEQINRELNPLTDQTGQSRPGIEAPAKKDSPNDPEESEEERSSDTSLEKNEEHVLNILKKLKTTKTELEGKLQENAGLREAAKKERDSAKNALGERHARILEIETALHALQVGPSRIEDEGNAVNEKRLKSIHALSQSLVSTFRNEISEDSQDMQISCELLKKMTISSQEKDSLISQELAWLAAEVQKEERLLKEINVKSEVAFRSQETRKALCIALERRNMTLKRSLGFKRDQVRAFSETVRQTLGEIETGMETISYLFSQETSNANSASSELCIKSEGVHEKRERTLESAKSQVERDLKEKRLVIENKELECLQHEMQIFDIQEKMFSGFMEDAKNNARQTDKQLLEMYGRIQQIKAKNEKRLDVAQKLVNANERLLLYQDERQNLQPMLCLISEQMKEAVIGFEKVQKDTKTNAEEACRKELLSLREKQKKALEGEFGGYLKKLQSSKESIEGKISILSDKKKKIGEDHELKEKMEEIQITLDGISANSLALSEIDAASKDAPNILGKFTETLEIHGLGFLLEEELEDGLGREDLMNRAKKISMEGRLSDTYIEWLKEIQKNEKEKEKIECKVSEITVGLITTHKEVEKIYNEWAVADKWFRYGEDAEYLTEKIKKILEQRSDIWREVEKSFTDFLKVQTTSGDNIIIRFAKKGWNGAVDILSLPIRGISGLSIVLSALEGGCRYLANKFCQIFWYPNLKCEDFEAKYKQNVNQGNKASIEELKARYEYIQESQEKETVKLGQILGYIKENIGGWKTEALDEKRRLEKKCEDHRAGYKKKTDELLERLDREIKHIEEDLDEQTKALEEKKGELEKSKKKKDEEAASLEKKKTKEAGEKLKKNNAEFTVVMERLEKGFSDVQGRNMELATAVRKEEGDLESLEATRRRMEEETRRAIAENKKAEKVLSENATEPVKKLLADIKEMEDIAGNMHCRAWQGDGTSSSSTNSSAKSHVRGGTSETFSEELRLGNSQASYISSGETYRVLSALRLGFAGARWTFAGFGKVLSLSSQWLGSLREQRLYIDGNILEAGEELLKEMQCRKEESEKQHRALKEKQSELEGKRVVSSEGWFIRRAYHLFDTLPKKVRRCKELLEKDIGVIKELMEELRTNRELLEGTFKNLGSSADGELRSIEAEQKTLRESLLRSKDHLIEEQEKLEASSKKSVEELREKICAYKDDRASFGDEIAFNSFTEQLFKAEFDAFDECGTHSFFEEKKGILKRRIEIMRKKHTELQSQQKDSFLRLEQKYEEISIMKGKVGDKKRKLVQVMEKSVEAAKIWESCAGGQRRLEDNDALLQKYSSAVFELTQKLGDISWELGRFDLAELDQRRLCRIVAEEIAEAASEAKRLGECCSSLKDKNGNDYIRKAFGEVGLFRKQKKATNLIINLIPLSECLPDGANIDSYRQALDELAGEGYLGAFRITLENKVAWATVAARVSLGVAQVVIGVFLNVYSMGAVSAISGACISEGIADIWGALYEGVWLGREFSWKDYAANKVISYSVGALFAGFGTLKDVGKTFYAGTAKACSVGRCMFGRAGAFITGSGAKIVRGVGAVRGGFGLLKRSLVLETAVGFAEKILAKLSEETIQSFIVNLVTKLVSSTTKQQYEELIEKNETARDLLEIDRENGNATFLQYMKNIFYRIINPTSKLGGYISTITGSITSKVIGCINEHILKALKKRFGNEAIDGMAKGSGALGLLMKCAYKGLQSVMTIISDTADLLKDMASLWMDVGDLFNKELEKEAGNKSSSIAKGLSEYRQAHNKESAAVSVAEESGVSVSEKASVGGYIDAVSREEHEDTQVRETTQKVDLQSTLTQYMATVSVEKTKNIVNKHMANGFRKIEACCIGELTKDIREGLDEDISAFKEERCRVAYEQGKQWRLRNSQKRKPSEEEEKKLQTALKKEADAISKEGDGSEIALNRFAVVFDKVKEQFRKKIENDSTLTQEEKDEKLKKIDNLKVKVLDKDGKLIRGYPPGDWENEENMIVISHDGENHWEGEGSSGGEHLGENNCLFDAFNQGINRHIGITLAKEDVAEVRNGIADEIRKSAGTRDGLLVKKIHMEQQQRWERNKADGKGGLNYYFQGGKGKNDDKMVGKDYAALKATYELLEGLIFERTKSGLVVRKLVGGSGQEKLEWDELKEEEQIISYISTNMDSLLQDKGFKKFLKPKLPGGNEGDLIITAIEASMGGGTGNAKLDQDQQKVVSKILLDEMREPDGDKKFEKLVASHIAKGIITCAKYKEGTNNRDKGTFTSECIDVSIATRKRALKSKKKDSILIQKGTYLRYGHPGMVPLLGHAHVTENGGEVSKEVCAAAQKFATDLINKIVDQRKIDARNATKNSKATAKKATAKAKANAGAGASKNQLEVENAVEALLAGNNQQTNNNQSSTFILNKEGTNAHGDDCIIISFSKNSKTYKVQFKTTVNSKDMLNPIETYTTALHSVYCQNEAPGNNHSNAHNNEGDGGNNHGNNEGGINTPQQD